MRARHFPVFAPYDPLDFRVLRPTDERPDVMQLEFGPPPRSSNPQPPTTVDDAAVAAPAADGVAHVHALMDEALRCALRSLMRGGRATDSTTLSALGVACTAARERAMPVEKLIVLIKARWRQLPDGQLLTRLSREVAIDSLDHVITACIEQYFGTTIRRRHND